MSSETSQRPGASLPELRAARHRPAALLAGKRLVQSVFAAFWGTAFFALGRVRWRQRARVARWSSPGGGTALVVAPHPDDEVCACGGVVLLHRQHADRVLVAYVTDGRRSTAWGLVPEEMAERRRLEAEAAAQALDVEARWLGLAEGDWPTETLVTHLESLLRELEPDWVYVPSCVDYHPEHRRVAGAVALAVERAVQHGLRAPRVRVAQNQVPLTAALTNLVADTSTVAERALAALELYRSQRGAIVPYLRIKRYTARFYGFARQGEELWELSAEEYRRLQAGIGSASRPFRSFRHYSWSDPLAYLVGRRERRRCYHRALLKEP